MEWHELPKYNGIQVSQLIFPHNGRADKDSYPHDGCADKDSYPHDGRADKDSYPHDRHNQYIMSSLQLWLSFSINILALIYLIDHTSF